MSLNQLHEEYPEHLNPFHGRRNSFRQSLRGIKRAIVKSFTGKDKEKPVIRPKPVSTHTSPKFVPIEHRHTESQIVFPRSRFSERVSKTEASRSPITNRQTIPATLGINPFEGEDGKSNAKNTTLPPKPAERTKIRRKKRAPIPPDSMNASGQYLSPSVNGSKWSLVSTESEMSSMCYSENEIEHVDVKDTDRNDEILKITQEIARFAQDTNNNSIREIDKDSAHRDNVDSTKIDKDSVNRDNVDSTKIEVRISPVEDEECVNKNHETAIQVHENNLTNDSIKPDKLENDVRQEAGEKSENRRDNEEMQASNTNLEISEKRDIENNISKEPNSQPEIDKDSKDEVTQDTKEDLNRIVVMNDSEQNVDNYNSTSSKNSKQTYEDTEIEEDTVELRPHNIENQSSENRFSVKGKIEFFEYTYSSPTPKIRKNILTKEKLLGSEESV